MIDYKKETLRQISSISDDLRFLNGEYPDSEFLFSAAYHIFQQAAEAMDLYISERDIAFLSKDGDAIKEAEKIMYYKIEALAILLDKIRKKEEK